MSEKNELEWLYQQALTALEKGQDRHASELLKEILLADEDYRDAAQLLANLVAKRKRRWFQDLRIWTGLIGLVTIAAILIFRDPLLGWISSPGPSATQNIATLPSAVTSTRTPSPTVVSSPTPIALYW